jgi:tubulin delta
MQLLNLIERQVVAAAMKRPCGSPLSNPGSWSYSQNHQVICDSGSGNNWARGFYVHGPRCRDSILDIVRLEVI